MLVALRHSHGDGGERGWWPSDPIAISPVSVPHKVCCGLFWVGDLVPVFQCGVAFGFQGIAR